MLSVWRAVELDDEYVGVRKNKCQDIGRSYCMVTRKRVVNMEIIIIELSNMLWVHEERKDNLMPDQTIEVGSLCNKAFYATSE